MKRSHLLTGIAYVIAGMVLLLASLPVETRLGSLLFGFGFACLVPGLVMICKYFYWNAPENRARYQEKLDQERVELRDELNQKLSERSSQYAYVIGLGVTTAAIVVFSLLDALEVIQGGRLMVLYLGAYLVFQVVIGQVIYRRLRRKYQ